jgi:hypothetical protein
LKPDVDLNFRLDLPEEHLETLFACIWNRINQFNNGEVYFIPSGDSAEGIVNKTKQAKSAIYIQVYFSTSATMINLLHNDGINLSIETYMTVFCHKGE